MPSSVPDICDAFPGEVAVLEPIFRDYGGSRRFSGEIATIKCFEDNSLVGEAVRGPGKGRVLVVDGGGSLRRALLGDRLAAAASDNGWSGVVINGCVRDVEILATIELGVKALAACPLKTDKRGEGHADVSLRFAGAQMEPGQYLYADVNGIAIVPHRLDVDF